MFLCAGLGKVLVLIIIFFVIGIYLNIGDEDEGNPLIDGNKGVNPNGHINEKSTSSEKEGVTEVTEGLAVTIGKNAKEIEKEYR